MNDILIKHRLREIVKELQEANERAHSSFLYARKIDLALRGLPREIASLYRDSFNEVQSERGDKILDIARLRRQYADSERSLAEIAESLK